MRCPSHDAIVGTLGKNNTSQYLSLFPLKLWNIGLLIAVELENSTVVHLYEFV